MSKVKKIIFPALILLLGMLLVLAGTGLLQLTPALNLYSGIILLILAVTLYFVS